MFVAIEGYLLTERENSRFWQNIGHFLLPFERVQHNLKYIGKIEFFGTVTYKIGFNLLHLKKILSTDHVS